ncbi:hypothetical protein HIM_07083 [Hirsutella minnesotensis 3608]|uniref:Arrestin C-terminal-like domain-containing protein n=1 Tax=Hirsutella minnesotensis 3608 TaxID=1043627 RepID=A0A0F7ZZ34_9HYPO|nr:hypothetical protein HIM_07083 [Hirsutella minnesotensis 3608]
MPRDSLAAGTSRPLSSSSLPNTLTSSPANRDAAAPSTSALGPSSNPTTKTTTILSRPSLLSRITLPLPLPLRNRNRNVADFHIRCDDPYRKYSAGDSVRGSVILAVVKPLRITHLVVSLHGHVRVLKDPTAAAKAQHATAIPPAGASSRPQYHGNGLASLFQDEQVLSGEGRLEPGKYEFGFDLVFPNSNLPSSIDFERGTISYMVAATLTRPTTIAPTSSCDRKVLLTQNIDIGMLAPPRPRTIFLEPISKRMRRKRTVVLDKSSTTYSDINDVASEPDSIDRSVVTDDSGRDTQPDHRSHILSDVRSEVSGESGRSGVSRVEFAPLPQPSTSMTSAAKQQFVDDRTITATIELLRGGCLPGDTVSVRVTVQHIKRVKSMTGVIVTFYRQGKIDTSPQASRFAVTSKEEAAKLEKEEIFPRSRTNLGGLSLSSTSSTSIFRKDLDQNAAPLIIDPATLQASVTIPVRVPDDAFPTIKGVPGDMISFKYQVEVVVDLGGRLASQLHGGQSSSRFGPYGSTGIDQGSSSYAPRRSANIADTTQLRREKGVISVSMETVVGTIDSSRTRKSTRRSPESRTVRIQDSGDEDEGDIIRPEATSCNGASTSNAHAPEQAQNASFPPHPNDYQFNPPPGEPPAPFRHPSPRHHGASRIDARAPSDYRHEAAPSYMPSPQVVHPGSMTEKERIRDAETRLLPSRPPAAGPSGTGDDDIYDAEDTPRLPPLSPSAPFDESLGNGPSAPTEEQLTAGRPVDDKQELERVRLMNEASAPPEFPRDLDGVGEGSSRQQRHDDEPSAPVLDVEDNDHGDAIEQAGPSANMGGREHVEQLPAYER